MLGMLTMDLTRLSPFLKGFIGALVAFALVALVWMVYVDHQRTTAMWAFINQTVAAQQAGAKSPTPPPCNPARHCHSHSAPHP